MRDLRRIDLDKLTSYRRTRHEWFAAFLQWTFSKS